MPTITWNTQWLSTFWLSFSLTHFVLLSYFDHQCSTKHIWVLNFGSFFGRCSETRNEKQQMKVVIHEKFPTKFVCLEKTSFSQMPHQTGFTIRNEYWLTKEESFCDKNFQIKQTKMFLKCSNIEKSTYKEMVFLKWTPT